MSPTKIMLIRHAEKQPDDPPGPPPYGINEDGEQDRHSLSPRGWQRAGALIGFFARPIPGPIAKPNVLYACAVDTSEGVGDDSKSVRPQQTVMPLARKLGVVINTDFVIGEEAQLATSIRSRLGVVLVAWEHKHIPLIATALGADAPSAWPDDRFDMVWVLTPRGDRHYLAIVNQSLLQGDA
jgi:hypothetical protein